MTSGVHSYSRQGGWTSSHSFYYECTYKTLEDYKVSLQKLENKEKELIQSNKDVEPEIRFSIIHNGTNMLENECYRHATSTHLFACMTIEAFLNHYGVKRLGEAYYKRNLERVGITEKLSILILACLGSVIKNDAELIKKTRALFDARNRLVHPKSREIDFGNLHQYVNSHPKDLPIIDYVDDMEYVLSELSKLDPAIHKSFEFALLPNK